MDIKEINKIDHFMKEKLPTVALSIPILISLILVLSVAYDWGFLFWIGVKFSEIPTTIDDHIRTALVWIPNAIELIISTLFPILFILFIPFILSLLQLIYHKKNESVEETTKTDKPISRFKKLLANEENAWLFIAVILLIALLVKLVKYFFYDTKFLIDTSLELVMFLVAIWNCCFFKKTSILKSIFLFYLPVAIFLSIYGGIISVGRICNCVPNSLKNFISPIKNPSKNIYIFEIDEKKKNVVLVRSYNKYFITWNFKEKKFEFIATSSVKNFYPLSK